MNINEPRPIAAADHMAEQWWDATREQRFLLQRCEACGHHQHYPRAICTACGSLALIYVQASGRGTIYSFTEVARAPHPAFEPPYVVALIRLEEGPTVMSNIVGEIIPTCDAAVTLGWEPLPDGRQLPLFALTEHFSDFKP